MLFLLTLRINLSNDDANMSSPIIIVRFRNIINEKFFFKF